MGFLSRLTLGQQSPWLALTQQPQFQQAPPLMQQTQPPQEMVAPPRQTTAELRRPSWNERFQDMMASPMLATGLSLLGNAREGGDWSAVGRDIQAWNQQNFQRDRERREDRRLDAADRRADTQFGWAQGDRDRSAADRERYRTWAATRDEFAQVNPEAAYDAEADARALAGQPVTPYQQATLTLQQQGLRIDAARAARDMSTPRPLSNIDNRTLNQVTDASDQANAFNADITRFLSLNAEQPTGAFTQYNPGSWIGESRNRRDEMEGITSRLISSVRAMSGEGGIMTDADALRFERGLPSVNRAGPVNQNIAAAAQQAARNASDRVMFYEMYAQNRGSLLGARSDWNRYLAMNPIYDAQGNLQQDRPGFEEWVQMGSPDLRRAGAASRPPPRPPGVPPSARPVRRGNSWEWVE